MSSSSITAVSTVNPFNEEIIAQHKIMGRSEVSGIVNQARTAFVNWRNIGISRRAEFIDNFAREIRKNKTDLAATCTREMGKPIKESLSEVEKCAWIMQFYSDNGPTCLNDEAVC